MKNRKKSITHFHLYVLKNIGTPNIFCNHELYIQKRKVVFAWKENWERDAEIQKMINEKKNNKNNKQRANNKIRSKEERRKM